MKINKGNDYEKSIEKYAKHARIKKDFLGIWNSLMSTHKISLSKVFI